MAPKSEWTLEEVDDAVRGGAPEAVAAIEWFWREGSLMERHSEFIRRAKEWRTRSEVQALFERLRPAPPMRQDKQFPGLVDWLALSSVLGRTDEILAWFDARVAANDLPVPQMSRLMSALLERGKWVDWLAFSEPLASVTDLLASVGSTQENLADAPELLEFELTENDCEVALWRRVAEVARPAQLADVDAAIDASQRSDAIRSWLAKPMSELTEALLEHQLR